MKPLTIACAVLILLGAGALRAEAQGVASSFDQLSVLVKPGDRIRVIDLTGTQLDGRIDSLSRDVLTLVTETGPRPFGEGEVATIRQRRADSLKNGAIIGAVAGAAYGFFGLWVVAMTEGDLDPGRATTAVLFCTGIGAAMGAGIDALITRARVIYQRPGGSSVTVSPLVGNGRRGAAISVRF